MKGLSAIIVIAALCLVAWALPAGAEKIRLTDAEMDGIMAGASLNIPPPSSVGCCLNVFLSAVGGAMPPMGSLLLDICTIPGTCNHNNDPGIGGVNIMLNAFGMVPGGVGVGGTIAAPKGIVVPVSFFLPF